ncbi:hypothetical protein BJY04DRAFT_181546 [Aspergillus karnatakaensis]|uniref:uncharacterized protein n=1 Tax=Aspergillus karnatakaensis TaxID=1810916 RepID=UPI003CCD2C77
MHWPRRNQAARLCRPFKLITRLKNGGLVAALAQNGQSLSGCFSLSRFQTCRSRCRVETILGLMGISVDWQGLLYSKKLS